ncbi:acyl-CoA thioesterase [Desulfovibrio sp. OttesenSCG-928-C06]|nr:acyl-CoA thioesterase [Desulfovibrio sp. OttesenSCG-928-C06]
MRFDSDAPFRMQPGAPEPLGVSVTRKVRFGECDPMCVVWHGTYAVYAEEAREALVEACGFPYEILRQAEVVMPIKALFFDYLLPLRFGQEYAVSAFIHWTEAARVNMEYLITDADGRICTKGFSVQLITSFSGGLILDLPPFYRDFMQRWKAGELARLQLAYPGKS